MKNKFYILITACIYSCSAFAQGLITFQVQAGRQEHDVDCIGAKATDGGYVAASTYDDGDQEIFVVKTNEFGVTQWTQVIRGIGSHEVNDIEPTSDNGFILCGDYYRSTEGYSALAIRLNSLGDTMWTRTYAASGNTGLTHAHSIVQASDGGFIMCGYANLGNGNYDEMIIMKLNSDGDISWTKAFGGFSDDVGNSVVQTSDGGFIAAGKSFSFGQAADFYLVKTTATGSLSWSFVYGGSTYDEAQSISQTNDGGYIVSGQTSSFGAGVNDMMLMKINSTGTLEWARAFGDANYEYCGGVCQVTDGGYVVAGYAQGGAIAIKTTGAGDTAWVRSYGGNYNGQFFSVSPTGDGGVLLCGEGAHILPGGWEDISLVKTDADGVSSCHDTRIGITVTEIAPEAFTATAITNTTGQLTPHTADIPTYTFNDSTVCLTVGIQELQRWLALTVFPNPFEDEIRIQGTMNSGYLVIYDISGREVYRQDITQSETVIRLEELVSSLYYYTYYFENSYTAGKIMKQ